jgi:murein DD-endopeptidase MepM/ murein hydrolase activator NlpD
MKSLKQQAIDLNLKGPDGGWAWYWIPGDERYVTSDLPSDGPDPSSKAVWPLDNGLTPRVYRFDSGPHPRGIGYVRGGRSRAHVGIDLRAKKGDTVLSVDDGTIVSFYYFYRSTFALFIDHGDYIVNYGEVDKSSLDRFGLVSPWGNISKNDPKKSTGQSGSVVKAGQPIALVGKMYRSSMLHFEMYSSGKTNQRWTGFPSGSAPSRLLNPTNFLLTLANRKIAGITVVKEPTVKTQLCR